MTLTLEKLEEARGLVKYVLDGGGEQPLEPAQRLLLARYAAALSAVPEDVARLAARVRQTLEEAGRSTEDCCDRCHYRALDTEAVAAVDALATAAARVPGLEAEMENLTRRLALEKSTSALRLKDQEAADRDLEKMTAERDAARLEADAQAAMVDEWSDALGLAPTDGYDKAASIRAERDALQSRVAELEREKEAAARTLSGLRAHLLPWQRGPDWLRHVESAIATEQALMEAIGTYAPNFSPAEGPHEVVAHLARKVEDAEERMQAAERRVQEMEGRLTTPPAPAGLLEAVGPIVERLRTCADLYGDPMDWGVWWGAETEHDPVGTVGEARAILAAYDAAKAGEVPRVLPEARVVEVLMRHMTDLRGTSYSAAVNVVLTSCARALGLTLPGGETTGCSSHPGQDCAPETPGVYECRAAPASGPLLSATPVRVRRPEPTPEVPALTQPVNLSARRVQRDAPEQVATFRPHVSFSGRPGACSDADCKDFVFGVETGRLDARLEAQPETWAGTYHAANEAMLHREAEAHGYALEVERTADPTWLHATFTRATKPPRIQAVPALAQPEPVDDGPHGLLMAQFQRGEVVPAPVSRFSKVDPDEDTANGKTTGFDDRGAAPATIGGHCGPHPVLGEDVVCLLPKGHEGAHDDGTCQPEPAAPEVVWEDDTARILMDGDGVHIISLDDSGRDTGEKWLRSVLEDVARALAEAKRERAEYADTAGRALATAAREAAQDMRERAALAAFDGTCRFCHRPIRWDDTGGEDGQGAWRHEGKDEGCLAEPNGSPAAERIRALTLEGK